MEVEETGFSTADAVHREVPEFDDDHIADRMEEKGVRDRDPLFLVARDPDPVGYLVAYDRFEDGSYYVWMAGVVPPERRQGAMSALVGRAEEVAAGRGYDSVKIKTRNDRRAMRHFLVDHGYDVCGFEPVGDLGRHEIMHVKHL